MSVYIDYFGLREEPFSLAPDPRFLYGSEQHREALAHLLYGVRDGGGFVLLTGEIGTGKTTVFRCFLEDVPGDVRLALLLHPRLSSRELLASVCSEFGIPVREGGGTGELVDGMNRFLIDAGSAGQRAVIVIDEAQNLSPDALEELRLLTNLETNRRKLLQIVLIGQPELREMLAGPAMAQVSQRVVARYHLGPLEKGEMASYVRHRLATAGTKAELFSPSTYPLLFRLSRGIPRLINLICDRALLGAFAGGAGRVTPSLLRGAADEVLGSQRTIPGLKAQAVTAAVLAAAAIFSIGGWYGGRDTGKALESPRETVEAAVKEPAGPRERPVVRDVPPEPERTYGLEWLLEEAGTGTRSDGETLLFRLWADGKDGPEGDLCAYAAAAGLQCLEGTGSLQTLQQLDRPALLRIPTGKGGEIYAVLARSGEGSSRILFKGGEGEVGLKWFGAYTLLWKPPPGYGGELVPGRRSGAVPWLREGLTKAGFAVTGNGNTLYDSEVAEQVRVFQSSRGIEADGIAGPVTLIHLNSVLAAEGPRLLGGGS